MYSNRNPFFIKLSIFIKQIKRQTLQVKALQGFILFSIHLKC